MIDSKASPQSLDAANSTPPAKKPETATNENHTAPDITTAEMPPGGRPRPNHTLRREVDLSMLLTPVEKIELTALVSWLTDAMLRHITQLFDPTPTADGNTQSSRIALWSKLPTYLQDLSLGNPTDDSQKRGNQKENVKPSRPKKAGRPADKSDAVPNNGTAPSQDAKNSGPRLQELKKEALQHFKKWHTAVHRRVGEISTKRATEAQPSQFPSSGPKGRSSSYRRSRPGPRQPTAPALTVEADPVFMQLYPPRPTTLSSWPAEKRLLLLHSLLLLLLSLENYGAYTRVLLLNIASSLRLPLRVLAEDEVRVAGALAQVAKDIPPEVLMPKKNEDGKPSRRWKAGQAIVAGAAIGVAGGLAAPFMAAGIGSITGGTGVGPAVAASLIGSMAENSLAVASLFGIYGRSGGKLMEHYLKDVADFAFIPLRGSIGQDSEIGKIAPESRRLRVVLGVNGWLMNKTDTPSPWQCLGAQGEVYAVRWELETLTKLGASFEVLVKSAAWSMAKKEIAARTIFANLVEARWPAGLLKISKLVDNNWNNGMVRADKLGTALADVIMSKAQGERGVSLIGYSLGARAIYVCLMCLAEKRAFGLVENAVMMGTPAPSEPLAWCAMKSVVSGRLVNVYSENDYILGFLYRTSSIEFGLAGLQRVTGVDGIENVDVTAKISIHPRYQFLVGSILRHMGWTDTDEEWIARDEAAMAVYEERNRRHEERREAMEFGRVDVVGNRKENEQGVIRTRMRKKGKK